MIHEIKIENFKSIRQAAIKLTPINILIGANGAGKSNFLGFLQLLRSIYLQNLQRYISQNGGADTILYFGRKQSPYLSGSINFYNSYYHFKLVPNTRNFLEFIEEECEREKYHGKQTSESFLFTGLKETLINENIGRHLKSLEFYHFHDTSFTSSIKQFTRVHDNNYLREDGGNLAAFLYYLQQKRIDSFQLIEATIRSIAPFFKGFDLSPNRLNEEIIELKWLQEGSDMYLNAHNLSDGTLRMICLTTLLLQPDLPKTIIIDEPELGLHPVAINKLAGLLQKAAEKGSQIIVSTQSVGLIDNFAPEDIIVTDREEQQSVFKRLSTEELKDWLDEYSLGELWNKNIIGGRP